MPKTIRPDSVNRHDTALTDYDTDETPSFTLVPGSAREYLSRRVEMQGIKRAAPLMYKPSFVIAMIALLVILVLLIMAGLLLTMVAVLSGELLEGWDRPLPLALLLTILGVLAGTALASDRKGARQKAAMEALDKEHQAVRLQVRATALYYLLDTTTRQQVVAAAADEITPEVRARLLASAEDGDTSVAAEALSVLVREALAHWKAERDKKMQRSMDTERAAVRRVLGRTE